MADYYTLLTNAGIEYETLCKANGTPIKLTQMSVGDGGGSVYSPDASAKALRREVWRGSINALTQDSKNLSWLVAELTIPSEVGGWYVREAGIWTETGVLYAVIKYPESFKPVMADQGAGKEFYLRAIFQTSNAANVVLAIDDSVVKATRSWVADYVANELAKLDAKKSVRVATTGPITLSGAQTIDAIAVIAGDSVGVFFQADASKNGIYIVANGAWLRRADADTSEKVTPNLLVSVEEGAKNADTLWQLTTNAPIVLGTTPLAFDLVSGPNGVVPGTYRQVTVNRNGLIVGGANPTSLGGYGITDAYSKAEVDWKDAQLQNKLGYTPVQQGTGIGQLQNVIKIGYSDVGLKITVDATDFGTLWCAGNFDPSSKANWGSTLAAYGITNAYTKAETDQRDAQRVMADGISIAGLSGNSLGQPYLRRASDTSICWLQPKLDYTPVQQGTGIGQFQNVVKIGWSDNGLKLTVDASDQGRMWYAGNFDPSSKANWGSTLGAYGITDAYTVAQVDARLSQRVAADSITAAGFASDNPEFPYMRRTADGAVYYLQRRLGFTPVEQGGGPNMGTSKVRIGYNGSGSLRVQVDSTDIGDLISDANLSPKLVGLGLNGVGQYAFARVLTAIGSVNQGALVAGSNLIYSSTSGSDGASNQSGLINVGTWRVHGAFTSGERTLFQRVA